ncbi:hypothetical protein [Leptospira adleri]|uniref:hypothetical protein n=1 Tax=Leptospira adleri TaxID=2023186 RepID=UPI0010830763|nr:hypothetical protein [Leptospira adleri]TGM58576.1 hypothetical protein EHQ97_05620 [Leptospira adleri]
MEKNKVPIYKVIFNRAEELNKASLLLKKNIYEGERDGSYIAPSIFCSTFCLEILLKCLILIKHDNVFAFTETERKLLNGHKYSDLFKKIDPDIQTEIVATYNTRFQENISSDKFVEMLQSLGDENFIKWRYIYEENNDKKLNTELENKILDALGLTASTLIKTKG